MDFPIHVLKSSQGVPIYFEEYPEFFRPTSIVLAMFSGGADDAALNAPGIHHWGEHIPFRGTTAYPLGSAQIFGRMTELGGSISAYTAHLMTVYYASAPKTHWLEAASIVTDLAARPLLRPEDIEAERKIIGQEITQANADLERRWYYMLRHALWAGHPLGDRVIGTKESLARMRIDDIEHMRSRSYGCNRASVFVAGSMKPQEVQNHLSELLEHLPNNPIEERRRPASYGPFPAWQAGKMYAESSDFDASYVALAFPLPPKNGDWEISESVELAAALLQMGALASPLYRIVREERQLAYSAGVMQLHYEDGGVFALTAKTSRDKVDATVGAFRDVLAAAEVRSDARWNYIRETIGNKLGMYLPNPSQSTGDMLQEVTDIGTPRSVSKRFEAALSVPRHKVTDVLDSLTSEKGRVIAMLGKK